MNRKIVIISIVVIVLVLLGLGKTLRDQYANADDEPDSTAIIVSVYPDSVFNNVDNHPVGINLDFFMDGGRYPNASRSVAEALKDMGVKYLRYPGGDKSDLNLFSVPPYDKSQPTLART